MSRYKYEEGLESQRLKTRMLTEDDMLSWTGFLSDKDCVEFFPKVDYAAEQRSKEWVEKQLKRYREHKYGLQALHDKTTNEFIGQCGLLEQEVDGKKELEVGYHIFKKYWGRGYAPEAAKLFLNYAFLNDLADSVISIIHHQNLKSQKVALKNGLIRDKGTKWLDMDVLIFRIEKKDWQIREMNF